MILPIHAIFEATLQCGPGTERMFRDKSKGRKLKGRDEMMMWIMSKRVHAPCCSLYCVPLIHQFPFPVSSAHGMAQVFESDIFHKANKQNHASIHLVDKLLL